MKVLVLTLAFLAMVAVALADGETTVPPPLCDIVCPKPLPEETVLLPSPESCEEYCQCDPRGAIKQFCPIYNMETGERLRFNAEAQICDWPEAIECMIDV